MLVAGEDRAGGAANVALNISALGAKAALSGIIGDDENARCLSERLNAADIQQSFITSKTSPTITKINH